MGEQPSQPEPAQVLTPDEELKRLEEEATGLEAFISEILVDPSEEEENGRELDYDPLDAAEERLAENRQQQERLRARLRADQDRQMNDGLRKRGQDLADAAQARREPQMKTLNWTLSGLSGGILSVSYSFLRLGADGNASFYLKSAMFLAGVAIAAHVLQKLGHFIAETLVMARGRHVAVTRDFDDPAAVYEWLDSTTAEATRWHVMMPFVAVMVQASIALVAFFVMLLGITSST